MWKFIEAREARRYKRGKKLDGTGVVWTKRTPTPVRSGKHCDNIPLTELKSEGYAYNILDPKKIVHQERLDEFDYAANIGFRRVTNRLPEQNRLQREKRNKALVDIDRQYNRIARTRPQVERYKRGWNLVTNARKRGSSPQSLGRSPRALPVWERLERSNKDTGVVERFGAYGGLKNRLGKAEHCIIPPYQEKHKADRIFPNQITREETINEMFGTVKKPPRYKQSPKSPRYGGLLSKTGGAARKSPRLGSKSIVRATI